MQSPVDDKITDVEVVDTSKVGKHYQEFRIRIYARGHASNNVTGRWARMNRSQLLDCIESLGHIREATSE